MGYSSYSYVCFGIKTKKSSIEQNKKQRSCRHKISSNMKFCPECGKPAFNETKEVLLEPMEKDQLSYFYSDHASENIILGFLIGDTLEYDNEEFVELKFPTTQNMVDEIMKFCKENDLPYTEKNCKYYKHVS